MESKQDSGWLQGTRRHTRSASNQEKEAKDKKAHVSSVDTEVKKKETVTTGQIRGQNNEIVEYITEDGTSYKVSDSAYIATERSDHPYSISTIQEIKPSKKDDAVVVLKWYYRPGEVPDSVYQMLVKERIDATDDQKEKEVLLDVDVRSRELFIADDDDVNQVFPVSALRGKCNVVHFSSCQKLKDYQLVSDSFFYILGYNPNTRRLTNIQGEVKVGPSHQWTATTRGALYKAIIPACEPMPPPSSDRVNKDYEEMIWEPRVNDCDLIMYLRSARSMAAFAGMCDGGSTEEGCIIASRDETTINAFNLLFQCNGDVRMALQALVKKPLPLTVERKWTEDQVKRFQKGLRQNGKNFYKIRKDHLPGKETSDLVEFYYLWKKVQDSLMVLPQNKQRRQATMKRSGKTATPSTENGDVSSSENDSTETDDSGKESVEPPQCANCRTTNSDDWNVGGKKSLMLCTKCRIKFKKYGTGAQVHIDLDNRTPSEFGGTERRTPLSSLFPESSDIQPCFMFKPIKEKLKGTPESNPQDDVDDGDEAQSPDLKRPKKRKWKKNEQRDAEDMVKEKKSNPEVNSNAEAPRLIKTLIPDVPPSNPGRERIKEEADECRDNVDHKQPPTSEHPPPPHFPPAQPLHPFNGKGDGSSRIASYQESFKLETRPTKAEEEPGFPSAQPLFYPPPRPLLPSPFHLKQEIRADHPVDSRSLLPPNTHHARLSPSLPLTMPNSTVSSAQSINTPSFQPSLIGRDSKPLINQPRVDAPPLPSSTNEVNPNPTSTSTSNQASDPKTSEYFQTNTDVKSCEIKSSHNDQNSPSDVVCVGEDSPPLFPPILPEHHVTIPNGEKRPSWYREYRDGVPNMDRSKNPITSFKGQKVRLSSFPGFTCSRTDMTWIPLKTPSKPELKQPSPSLKQTSQTRPNVPPSKDKEIPRPKPRTEPAANVAADHVTVKREVSRPYIAGHMKPPNQPPSHGRMSTPLSIPTPTVLHDPSRPLPAHSSPYTSLGGHATPAADNLRQFPNIDPQREAVAGLLAHGAQPHYPFGLPQNERDLRDRELRERELRERMPKLGLTSAKMFDSLDPQTAAAAAAQAMALPGVHPSLHPGLGNQQVLDQIRQSVPASVMGLHNAPQLVSNHIPGIHPLLAANPELLQQNATEAERLALAQRMFAEQRNILAQQYQMELLQNHQHSHVHSHLHLHPQNPPPGAAVFTPPVPPVNDPLMNQYAALALQQNPALAGVDPVQAAAAASMNPVMNLNQLRPPLVPTPAMPVVPHMLPPDPNVLLTSQLQAAVHENLLEHQRAIHQQQQHEMLMKMMYAPKP